VLVAVVAIVVVVLLLPLACKTQGPATREVEYRYTGHSDALVRYWASDSLNSVYDQQLPWSYRFTGYSGQMLYLSVGIWIFLSTDTIAVYLNDSLWGEVYNVGEGYSADMQISGTIP